ncbi:MBG domain-containing protein [Cyclobacterium roseum]|uniref:MBG domain-containing protein n=1 Tax=Cyclobacterium roseum TaxID=2666137 RepID=UPI00139138B9|nr:MBG domain-containing protein [Cyclobacterium roseum]
MKPDLSIYLEGKKIFTLIFIALSMIAYSTAQASTPDQGIGTQADPYRIATAEHLLWLSQTPGVWDEYFVQTANIDASGLPNPIGNSSIKFTGGYNGWGHDISNLSLNSVGGNLGLFGVAENATIKNLRVVDASINGGSGVAVLIGRSEGTTSVSNVFVSGTVHSIATGASDAGGLVGYAVTITVSNSGADVTVTGAGRNLGGFVGDASGGSYSNCYALGDVTATGTRGQTGGFAGLCRTNLIENSYARGNVSQGSSTLDQGAGGFVGLLNNNVGNTPMLENNFATGAASGGSGSIGGFLGVLSGTGITLNHNFFNTITSSTSTAVGTGTASGTDPITGINTATMRDKGTFTIAGWDFNSEWFITGTENDGFPIAQWAAAPTGTITLIGGASDSEENWTLNNGVLKPLLGNPSVSTLDFLPALTTATTLFDSYNPSILAELDIIINANLEPNLNVDQNLSLKAGRDIVVLNTRRTGATGSKLNLVFWSDTDGNEVGGVLFDANTLIGTNNGHLWVGGGDQSTTWNGLTVGDSFAAGLTNSASGTTQTYAGINAVGNEINAGTGNIYLYGKSTQTNYRFGIGIRINGMGFTGETISMYGIGSRNASTGGDTNRGNWGIGVENSSIIAADSIHLEGTGGGQNAGSNGGQNHGIRMDGNSSISSTGIGNINLIGTGGGNSAISANADNDGLRIDGTTIRVGTGTLTFRGVKGFHANSIDLDYTNGTAESRDGFGSLINGAILLESDELNLAAGVRLRSEQGTLTVRPRTVGTTVGIGGAAGTLQIASSYFSTNFENGFSQVLIGSENTGKIEMGGNTTYQDDLVFKSAKDISMAASASLTGLSGESEPLILWSDADGNDDGMIWLRESASITTNGGHLWMGGGGGTATWNGLTVGDSYAVGSEAFIPEDNTSGNQNGYYGITLDKEVTIQTGTGNIEMNGISGDQYAPDVAGVKYSANVGVYLGDGSQTSSTSGRIEINGVARLTADQPISGCTACGYRYGILFHRAGQTSTRQILVNSQSGDILLNGLAQDYTGNTTDFMNSGGVTLFAGTRGMVVSSESGNIEIIGENQETTAPSGRTARGVWLTTGQTDVTSVSGAITITAGLGIAGSEALALQASTKIGGGTSGDIEINTNGWTGSTTTTLLSGSGELRISPSAPAVTVGIGGASGTLQLPSSLLGTSFVNGFSHIRIGNNQTGEILIAGSNTYNDPLTLQSATNVTMNDGSSMAGLAGESASLVLWADADANKSGSIFLSESTIQTNGGHLWMAGGAESATAWNGLTVGDGSSYADATHSFSGNSFKNGVSIFKSTLASDNGDLFVSGIAEGVSGAPTGYNGVYIEQSSLSSGAGDIDLEAISTGTDNDGSWHYGLLMGTIQDNTSAIVESTSGAITINGETDFNKETHGAGVGLYTFGNANSEVIIRSVSGAIDVTGQLTSSGFNGQYGGIFLFGSGEEQIVSQTGNISLVGTSANTNVAGINQSTGNTSSAIGFDGANPFNGDITFSSNTFINYSGVITADNLELLGAGVVYDFSNSGNNVNSLTANTGRLTYLDSDELTLNSILATGEIEIATESGNLILSGNVSTSSSSTDAIILNAGNSESIGTETGGDIVVSGSPTITTGASGIAKLYSGSEPASTGLTDLVGGVVNVRKEVDEMTTTFDPVLEAGNAYALYRYQDIIQLTLNSQNLTASKTYDGTIGAAVADILLSGIRSGDEVTVTGEATYENTSIGTGKTITVVYTLGGTDAASYVAPENTVVTDGEIVAKELTISGLAGNDKVYDGTTTATLSGTASLDAIETGDEVTLEGTPALTFADANVGTGVAITVSGYTISGSAAANYSLAQPTGLSADITPRTLGITADSDVKVYDGAALTNNGYSISSGVLAAGQTITSMTVTGSLTNVGTSTNAISTAEILDGSNNDVTTNYDITYVNGTLEITPANLTITADNKSKVYGEANPSLTFTYTGLVNGDTEVSEEPGISTTATAGSNVGTYPIALTGGSDANYDISLVAGELEITPANLTITADNKSKVYGEANPSLTFSYTGLVNGDTEVSEEPGISTTATESSNVGTYPIALTGGLDANYDISLVAGELEVTQAALTITADDQSKVYGEVNPSLTFSYTGLVNGDTEVSDEPGISTTATAGSNVGTYPIALTGGLDANYDISLVAGELEVTQAALTITADDKSKVYGEANPSLTFTYTGLVNGDTEVSDEPGISTTATAGSNVGTYPISLTGGLDANYDISLVAGELEVTQAALTITADDKSKVYGEVNPSLTFSYTGLVNGDTEVSEEPGISTTATAGSNVGTYPIALTGGLDANYDISLVAGELEITQAALTITADDKSKVYGEENPGLTFTYTGLVNGDTEVSEEPGISTTATAGSNVGTYPISLTGGLDANYDISLVAGELEVTQAALTITADDKSKVYGEANPSLTFSYTGLVNGDTEVSEEPSISTTATAGSNVGTYPISLTGGSDANYDISLVAGELEVTQAALTITADDKSKVYGEENPGLTFTYTGLVNGDTEVSEEPGISTTATAGSNVGTYPIALTGGSDANYDISLVAGELEVTQAALTITADDKSKVYGEANPGLTFTYTGLVNGDTEVSEEPGISTTATESSNVGTYPIALTGGSDANYDISLEGGTLTISQATLSVQALDQTKVFGTGDPQLEYSAEGFQAGDDESVLSGTLERAPGEQVGDYPIGLGDLAVNANYQLEFQGAVFTIVSSRLAVINNLPERETPWSVEPQLPEMLTVLTEDGQILEVAVDWDASGLDVYSSGLYTITGELQLADGIQYEEYEKAYLDIQVLKKPAPEDLTLSHQEFDPETTEHFFEIGNLIITDPVDAIHQLELVAGALDNKYFEIHDRILYWSSAERVAGQTTFSILVRVTDRDGNVLEKQLDLTRNRIDLNTLTVYNTFSPEDDGTNDTWGVPDLRHFSGVRLQVFDRSGERVFYTENPDIRWDGTYRGKALPAGAYTWILEVTETGAKRMGILNLLRK